MSKIEDELTVATRLQRRPDEKPAAYLKRLVRATLKLHVDTWDAVSSEAQAWAQLAQIALRDKKPVPPTPDAVLPNGEDQPPKERVGVATRRRIYEHLHANPKLTRHELYALLKQEGVQVVLFTISSTRKSFLDARAFFEAKGLLKHGEGDR